MGMTQGNNPVRVKKQNEVLVKEIIYKYGPISRSQIAERLSLTPPTITTNVNALLKQGLVYETEEGEENPEHAPAGHKTLGRKPVKIDFVENARYVIGAEINKYQIAVCLMNLRGKVAGRKSRTYMRESDDYQTVMATLAGQIDQVIQESQISRDAILGVGVGITGFVDPVRGILKKSAYQNWEDNQKTAEDLERLLSLPVIIENNARMRAVGEELFGNRHHADTFAYLLISYGIACPMYIKDSVHTGESSGAGEIGHVVVDIHGPKCEVCGDFGCLEEMASERAIVKQAKEAMKKGIPTLMNELTESPDDLTMKEILAAEEQGDDLAFEIVGKAIVYLGVELANIINFIRTPLVIIDGYLKKKKKNRELILKETKKHLFGVSEGEIEFQFVDFDPYTGARGAGALAIKKYFIEQ